MLKKDFFQKVPFPLLFKKVSKVEKSEHFICILVTFPENIVKCPKIFVILLFLNALFLLIFAELPHFKYSTSSSVSPAKNVLKYRN